MYGVNNVMISRAPLAVLELGMSSAAAGFQGTFFIVFAIVLRTVLMPLTRRIGTKRLMLVGAASFAVASLLFPLCTTYEAFLAVRAVQAVGLAVFWPLSVSSVVDVSDAGNVGSRLGISRFATAASMAVGPYAAFALDDAMGAGWLYGALLLASCLAIVALAGCKLPDGGARAEAVGAGGPSRGCDDAMCEASGVAGCAGGHVGATCEVSARVAQRADENAVGESAACGKGGTSAGYVGEEAIGSFAHSRLEGAASPACADDREAKTACRRRAFGGFGAGGAWLAGVLLVTLIDSAAAGLIMHFSAVVVGEFDGSLNAASYLSLYSIGGMIASLLLGRALDRGKWAIALPACIAAFGLGVAQLGQVHMNLAGLVVGGMLAGAGNSGVALCCMDIITRKAPVYLRDAALGYRQSCVDIGIAVAATAFGVAFDAAPSSQVVFLAWGVVMICFAVAVCVVCVRESARKARSAR